MIGLGLGVGILIFFRDLDKDFPHPRLFLLLGLFCAWVGAKALFYMVTPNIELSFGFWAGGGLVFFGGLLGLLLYLILYKALFKLSWNSYSSTVKGFILGHAIGRIGCFLTGCCFGDLCALEIIDRHPVQIYESMALILIFFVIQRLKYPLIFSYLFLYSLTRFILEFFRGDEIRGILVAGFSTSQLISLGLLAILGLWGAKGYFSSKTVKSE